jgi:hypothetical protein
MRAQGIEAELWSPYFSTTPIGVRASGDADLLGERGKDETVGLMQEYGSRVEGFGRHARMAEDGRDGGRDLPEREAEEDIGAVHRQVLRMAAVALDVRLFDASGPSG